MTDLILIHGETGAGKSMLARTLLSHYEGQKFSATVFDKPNANEPFSGDHSRIFNHGGNYSYERIRHLIDSGFFQYIVFASMDTHLLTELERPFFRVIAIDTLRKKDH